jgi:hypothetical protein
MKRIAFALALGALSTTAAMAASGDAWYGTGRAERVIIEPPVTYVEPVPGDRVIYYETTTSTAPVYVERQYRSEPYGYVVVEPVRENGLFVVEPRTYSRIDHGLFNRKGPNDFGS